MTSGTPNVAHDGSDHICPTKLQSLSRTASVDCIPRLPAPNKEGLNFPRFPLRNIETMEIPENLSEQESRLIDTLRVDEDQLNSTEEETRKQAECTNWRDTRSF